MSHSIKIEGFRPGKAPYDIIKSRVGEGEIMQEALGDIINSSFAKAISQEKLDTIGQPEIDIKKMVPGEKLTYTALVVLLPQVKLPDISSVSLKKKDNKSRRQRSQSCLRTPNSFTR